MANSRGTIKGFRKCRIKITAINANKLKAL